MWSQHTPTREHRIGDPCDSAKGPADWGLALAATFRRLGLRAYTGQHTKHHTTHSSDLNLPRNATPTCGVGKRRQKMQPMPRHLKLISRALSLEACKGRCVSTTHYESMELHTHGCPTKAYHTTKRGPPSTSVPPLLLPSPWLSPSPWAQRAPPYRGAAECNAHVYRDSRHGYYVSDAAPSLMPCS